MSIVILHSTPIILLVLLFTGFHTYAQNTDSLQLRYENENIIRHGNRIFKGEKKFKFADVSNEFKNPSNGFEFYQKALKSKRDADVLNTFARVSFVSFLAFVATGNRNGYLISLGSQFTFTLFSLKYRKRSFVQMDQAIKERNKQTLFR